MITNSIDGGRSIKERCSCGAFWMCFLCRQHRKTSPRQSPPLNVRESSPHNSQRITQLITHNGWRIFCRLRTQSSVAIWSFTHGERHRRRKGGLTHKLTLTTCKRIFHFEHSSARILRQCIPAVKYVQILSDTEVEYHTFAQRQRPCYCFRVRRKRMLSEWNQPHDAILEEQRRRYKMINPDICFFFVTRSI